MRAGALNRLVRIEKRAAGQDAAGQPVVENWVLVGELWAGIVHETGLGAIRSGLQGNVPASIARYSFLVRFESARALAIDSAMRAVYDGEIFEIKGLTRDFKNREKAFLICEQGGNDG